MPKDTNKRTARQKDADELHMTSTLAVIPLGLLTLIESNTASIDTTLDISLSVFRDAILGAGTKDFSTIQTVLDSIKDTDGIKKITDTVTIAGTITANAGTNLNTSALATHAKQDTIIGHIDGVEALLTTIDADTSNLDITLSAFRDAIRGANTKDFSTIQTVLDSIKDTDGIKKIVDAVTLNSLPTGDNTVGRVKVTDGTNIMPTMDVAARKGFVRPTDGTNYMPMMDSRARHGHVQLSDGSLDTNCAAFDETHLATLIGQATVAGLYGYSERESWWARLGAIYDYNTGITSLVISRAAGKSTFSEEYGANQVNTAIITPAAGLRLQIVGIITMIDADAGNILMDFATSTQKVWRHYGAVVARTQDCMDMTFIGDADEALTLNSTQGANDIFVLVNYREIEP